MFLYGIQALMENTPQNLGTFSLHKGHKSMSPHGGGKIMETKMPPKRKTLHVAFILKQISYLG